jgi:hypothetical protein
VAGRRQESRLGGVGTIGFFACGHERIIDGATLGHVADCGGDVGLTALLEWCEPNTGRELAAIRPNGEEVEESGAHFTVRGVAHEPSDMRAMPQLKTAGDEHVDGPTHQLIPGVPEQGARGRIGE